MGPLSSFQVHRHFFLFVTPLLKIPLLTRECTNGKGTILPISLKSTGIDVTPKKIPFFSLILLFTRESPLILSFKLR